ncbi:MAG: UvrD-helicase domain-containing protein, partial [Elusimicrobiota bacterium]
PILGIDSKDILRMILETSDKSFIIPAHIWTPWFSVLGDKSGFDCIRDCYEDLTDNIFAIETGLSSDPPMNWACSFLDNFRIVSNSDAHSPEKLGREANIFDTEMSYDGIYNALKHDRGFLGTIEFFPQEGKYHYDGHRKCNVCWDPVETIKHNGICSVCNKPVTKGVMYRVAELADRSNILEAKNRKDFYSITSLPSLISEILGTEDTSKKVEKAYFEILEKIGSDFYVLLFADISEIQKKQGDIFAEGIRRLREREVNIEEGFDGEFGKITVFSPSEIRNANASATYGDLFLKSPLVPLYKGGKSLTGFDEHSQNVIKDRPGQPPRDVRSKYSINPALSKNNNFDILKKSGVKFDISAFKVAYENTQSPTRRGGYPGKDWRDTPLREGNTPFQQISCDDTTLDEQENAINYGDGVCMVIAGPGSGKTHILTERIIRLIKNENVPQENILAVTFSNKAAEEMHNRVKEKISPVKASICTFHSFGLSVLKKYYKHFGRTRDFLIIDSEEIEEFKDNAFDLDDLIYLPVQLFQKNSGILQEYRKQYQWVLVDEFQDINPVQYELLRLISGDGNPNLFVIGDPDQAIYGFRGSDVRFIDKLKEDYPNTKVIHLYRSYRCPAPVLKVAGQVMQKSEYLKGTASDIKIEIKECETEKTEADFVAGQIEKMLGGVRSFSIDSGITDGTAFTDINSFSDFAILCRISTMFEPIVSSLKQHGIAYQVIGTDPFYKQEPYNSLLHFFKKNVATLTAGNEDVSAVLSNLIEKQNIVEDDKKKFIELGRDFGNDYAGFFQCLTMRKGIDDFAPLKEAVSVLTLHASKGLEFKAVFIPGCEDGIIPFELFDKKTKEELQEEKRLFYVGVTRSKKFLFLTYAKKRTFKGRFLKQQRSPFLDRIEKNLLHFESDKYKKQGPYQPALFEWKK